MDDSEEDSCYTLRLRYLAVRVLGYTHTEAGERTAGQIARELDLTMGGKREQPQSTAEEVIDEEVV